MLSITIMAHKRRERMARHLARQVDGSIVWDEQNDVWDTGRRALLAYDAEASHHLVIQDDAELPRGFLQGCQDMLAYVPQGHPVSLYMGVARTKPPFPMTRILDRKKSFAVFPGPWWGVAVIVPTTHIPDLVAFADQEDTKNYDHRIARYFDSVNIPCYYTLPSLVDHRRGESLVGRRGHRRALWATRNATGHNWTRGIVTPNGLSDFPPTP